MIKKKRIRNKNDKKKNPFLKNDGGIDLIDEDIDYIKYSIKKGKKSRKR